MNIAVVTTLNKKLYDEYGHRFFETYNWPFDLYVYSENKFFKTIPIDNRPVFSLYKECPDAKTFVEKNKERKFKTFKHDAVRFCYKVYSYTDFLLTKADNYDAVICIDADSIFHKPIDVEWVKKHLHRNDAMMCYLGRGKYQYSECGFLYFNMKHEHTKTYAKNMQEIYTSHSIFSLAETHDSYVWDWWRKKMERDMGIINNDIGDGQGGHVQARSILGEVYDHLKGPSRKKMAKSPENTKL